VLLAVAVVLLKAAVAAELAVLETHQAFSLLKEILAEVVEITLLAHGTLTVLAAAAELEKEVTTVLVQDLMQVAAVEV
jgi:inosine-uridine nucleoside N-ribohydrolase